MTVMMMVSNLLLLLWNSSCFTTGLLEMSGSAVSFFRRSNKGYANKIEKHLRGKKIKYKFCYKESWLYLYKLKGRASLSGIQKINKQTLNENK